MLWKFRRGGGFIYMYIKNGNSGEVGVWIFSGTRQCQEKHSCKEDGKERKSCRRKSPIAVIGKWKDKINQ